MLSGRGDSGEALKGFPAAVSQVLLNEQRKKPKFEAPVRSSLLSRVKDFLPQLEAANSQLAQKSQEEVVIEQAGRFLHPNYPH